MRFVRVQVRYCGRLGKPVGVFGACHHLKNAGKLSSEEIQLFGTIDGWFKENLPEPPIYKEDNPQKAICWFKVDTSAHLLERLEPLIGLLHKHDVVCDIVSTDFAGEIIYEDVYQVAVI
jgi:hypothetical protein